MIYGLLARVNAKQPASDVLISDNFSTGDHSSLLLVNEHKASLYSNSTDMCRIFGSFSGRDRFGSL